MAPSSEPINGTRQQYWLAYRDLRGRLTVRRRSQAGGWTEARAFEEHLLPRYGPAAVPGADGHLELFHPTAEGDLVSRRWQVDDPGWERSCEQVERLPFAPTSPVAAVLWGRQEEQLTTLAFAATKEGLMTASRSGVDWGKPTPVGKTLIEPHTVPVLVPLGAEELGLFYLRRRQSNDFPYLHWRRGNPMLGWGEERCLEELGHLTLAPTAVALDGAIGLYYWRTGILLEGQGFFWRRWEKEEGWREEQGPIGGVLASSPAVAGGAGELVAVYGGVRSLLYENRWTEAEGWKGEGLLPNGWATWDPALVVSGLSGGYSEPAA